MGDKERILVTVKTYPTLSTKYGETVCTAGLREDGSWIRLYPVPFRRLSETRTAMKSARWRRCERSTLTRSPRRRTCTSSWARSTRFMGGVKTHVVDRRGVLSTGDKAAESSLTGWRLAVTIRGMLAMCSMEPESSLISSRLVPWFTLVETIEGNVASDDKCADPTVYMVDWDELGDDSSRQGQPLSQLLGRIEKRPLEAPEGAESGFDTDSKTVALHFMKLHENTRDASIREAVLAMAERVLGNDPSLIHYLVRLKVRWNVLAAPKSSAELRTLLDVSKVSLRSIAVDALKSTDAAVRTSAVKHIGRTGSGDGAATDALGAMKPDREVIAALGAIGGAKAYEGLKRALKAKDGNLVAAAAVLLSEQCTDANSDYHVADVVRLP